MFEQMKAMGAIAGLLRDKERLAEINESFQEALERVRVVGEGGGGAVRVVMSGKLTVESVEFDPSFATGMGSDDNSRMLGQELVKEAVNDAAMKARVVLQKEMSRLAEEHGLPDIPGIGSMLGAGG